MTIEIMNMRRTYPENPWDFRIDRTTVLGNPFFLGRENARQEACDKYEEAFHDMALSKPGFQNKLMEMLLALRRYGKVRLFCWCAPKRCHGETIKKWLEAQE